MFPRYITSFNTSELKKIETEVLVIGAGIAGLFTAIQAAKTRNVLLITKKHLLESNTRYAQGGIAAVIAESDSPAYHLQDTLVAGAGLCSREAVNILVHESPDVVQELMQLGAQFDYENGELALTREGAHSQRRILHANGDATGYEIVRALCERALQHPRIKVLEEHVAIDLLTEDGECKGAILMSPNGEQSIVLACSTVLCTGGAGQLYRYTTNPEIATADGIGIAYRAGAEIKDIEFIQFHPTALVYPGAPRFLISEAVRGEGAILRNIKGERFMNNYHEQLELAPRDIVARAIVSEMENTQSTFVYLDITHETEELIKHRFPTIYEYCLRYGLDMTSDWIPVAPAAHYIMGGLKTDLNGETSINKLYACGEVSCTGVHGANRLASNSLSEALVFGKRIVQQINQTSSVAPNFHMFNRIEADQRLEALDVAGQRLRLQKLMVRYVGLKRDAKGLQKGINEIERIAKKIIHGIADQEQVELANLICAAHLVAQSALIREESRGGHYRSDFPDRDDVNWQKHIVFRIGHDWIQERDFDAVVE